MSQIRSYPEHVTFIFRYKVSMSKDKMSPRFFYGENGKAIYSPFIFPQYCDFVQATSGLSSTSVRQPNFSDRCRFQIKFVNSSHVYYGYLVTLLVQISISK